MLTIFAKINIFLWSWTHHWTILWTLGKNLLLWFRCKTHFQNFLLRTTFEKEFFLDTEILRPHFVFLDIYSCYGIEIQYKIWSNLTRTGPVKPRAWTETVKSFPSKLLTPSLTALWSLSGRRPLVCVWQPLVYEAKSLSVDFYYGKKKLNNEFDWNFVFPMKLRLRNHWKCCRSIVGSLLYRERKYLSGIKHSVRVEVRS